MKMKMLSVRPTATTWTLALAFVAFLNASLTYWRWKSLSKSHSIDTNMTPALSDSHSHYDEGDYTWVGDDYPLYYPMPSGPLPKAAMSLYDSAHYDLSLPSPTNININSSTSHLSTTVLQLQNESNSEWALLATTPAGFGRTRLGPEQRMFVLTVYHYMHCIRKLEVALMDRMDEISTFHHALHCLNYLRQGFLCAANEGLEEGDWLEEWGEEDWELLDSEGGDGVHLVREGSGFREGTVRGELVCEDWEMAYEEFDRNHERFEKWRDEWN